MSVLQRNACYSCFLSPCPSIHRPDAGGKQFKQVFVRIAKVDAGSTFRPLKLAFNRDGVLFEAGTPVHERILRDAKADMADPAGAMGRNGAKRKDGSVWITPFDKEKQH